MRSDYQSKINFTEIYRKTEVPNWKEPLDFKVGDKVLFIKRYYINLHNLPSGGWIRKGTRAVVVEVSDFWVMVKTISRFFRLPKVVPLFYSNEDPLTSIKCIKKFERV